MNKSFRTQQLNAEARKTFVDAGLDKWWGFTQRLSTAKMWVDFGFTPSEALEWRQGFVNPLGTDPSHASEMKQRGYTPESALEECRTK